MIKSFILIFLLIFFSNYLFAQSKITGTVFSKINEPVSGANVVLNKKKSAEIKAFAITDSKGFFEIIYLGEDDSVTIKVSVIGYESKSQTIFNKSQSLKFVLGEENTVLPTVIIKEAPITQNGDTTNYLVKKYTTKQDRVIGDIIAKLPGVEIDESTGAIKFNGKPISHYYIDGLDLLEKKYNIANRNIPADMVEQVQLLDNHQNIKLLDSLVKGTEPALNIKLKKNAKNKLIGKAKTGLGITPLLWDNELIGLQFNPAFQLITSYKNNNAGSPLANELSDNISIQRVGDNSDKNLKEEIVNKLNTQQLNIGTKRYLFNNTNLLFFNALKVLPNEAQLKLNVSYLNDYTINENSFQSLNTLPTGQQINITENKNGILNVNKIEGNIIYNVNNQKVYLKNNTKAKLDFTKEANSIINAALINQNLQNPYFDYSNNFLAYISVKKKIVSVNSKINFNKTPQQLDVEPGQFNNLLNQSIAYDKLTQMTTVNNFNTDNYVSFLSNLGKLNQSIKIGAEYVHKNIQTNINKLYNQTTYQLNDTFKNNVNWNNTRLYAETETTIGKKKRKIDITFPLELNLLQTQNKIEKFKTTNRNLFFNPSVGYRFPIIENTTGEIGCNLQNSIGSFTNILSGYFLSNYRVVSRNDSLIPIQQLNNVMASIYYKSPINSIFSNFTLSASKTKRNIIYNQVFDGFLSKSVGSYLDNYQKNLMINGNTSKYFIKQKLNLNLSYSYNIFQTDILQQNIITQSNSKLFSLGFKCNYNKLSFVSIESNSKFDNFKNEIKSETYKLSITNKFHQNLRLFFYLTQKSLLNLSNEFYSVWDNGNNKGNYFFGDIGFRQKFKKTELELEWQNITNRKKYVTINNSENLQQINSYIIRPTNLTVKFYFNF